MTIGLMGWVVLVGFTCQCGQAGENDLLKPVNLGPQVNTEADETDPYLAPGNQALLYVSNATGSFDMYLSIKSNVSEPWQAGQALNNYNAKDADERSPFYTANKTLYFASNRIPDPRFKDLQNFDILERQGGRQPSRLLQVSQKEDEMFPWVTPKGTEFYFNRKTANGWRLFVSRGPAFGGISKGKLIEEIPAGFVHPTLTPNGLTMYLQGLVGEGRWALFQTTRPQVGGKWSQPKPLVNLNHPDGKQGDMAPSLSPSGNTLFFASDRPGGSGGLDLWMVKTSELKVGE